MNLKFHSDWVFKRNLQKATLTQSRNSPWKDTQAWTPTYLRLLTSRKRCPTQISKVCLLMESSPLQTVMAARMEVRRPEQITLRLLAIDMLRVKSSHTVRLNFKVGEEMQSYYVPREKERHWMS